MEIANSPYDHERLYMAAFADIAQKLLTRGFNGWRAGGAFYTPVAFVDARAARDFWEGDASGAPIVLEIDMSRCSEKVFQRPSYVGENDYPLPPNAWPMFGKIPREAFSEFVPSTEPTRSPGP